MEYLETLLYDNFSVFFKIDIRKYNFCALIKDILYAHENAAAQLKVV